MTHATVGVIGHVNHGKSALVKALTGTDTDRLEEEKRRGMSIVLGFAYLALDAGVVDLVDVPGHEQFVRTMIAGATGIQASLLVVDAREAIKPQTTEHVAIADLLGVRRGVVAISKCDLADAAQRAAVRQRLRAFLRGTHLEFAPVVFTSAASGEGIAELQAELARLLAHEAQPADAAVHAWLPVDRVFALPGHGAVVTGTLRGRPLRVGETLCAMPRGAVGVVRQLQVHRRPVAEVWPGQRVGVNLRHVRAEQLARGDVLAPPGRLRAGVLLDVQLKLLPATDAATLDGARVRLLFGTAEAAATVRVLAHDHARLLAQLRTDRPVVAVAGQSFIVRRESPPATLAGGQVLDAAPARHQRSDAQALARLRVLAGGSSSELLAQRLHAAAAAGLPLAELALPAAATGVEIAQAIAPVAFVHRGRAWDAALVEALVDRVLEDLRQWHAAQPLRAGAPLSLVRSATGAHAADELYRALLQRLQSDARVVLRQGAIALAGHDPLAGLDEPARRELAAMAAAFRTGGSMPPDPPAPGDARRRLFELLVDDGELLLLPAQPRTPRVALHRESLAHAHDRLASAFPPPGGFTVSQAREVLGSTRKFVVPMLEHLHAAGHTRRRGDLHMFVGQRTSGGE